jgi:hypothetical protein
MATALKHEYEEDTHELSDEEASELFEKTVQRRLKMSTEEFLRKLDAGDFKGREEEPHIMSLLMRLPLVR